MNRKHTSYLETAIRTSKNVDSHPNPYMYQNQKIRGFNAPEDPYGFNKRLGAYLDQNGLNMRQFANKVQAFGNSNGYNIRFTHMDVHNYIYCKCKPKSAKFHLLCRYMDVEEGWLAGYNSVETKEAAVEHAITIASNRGFSAVSRPTDDELERIRRRREIYDLYRVAASVENGAQILEQSLRPTGA